MKKTIILFFVLLSASSFANNLECAGGGYSFNISGSQGTISTPDHVFDVIVSKSGSNYSGVIREHGFYAYRMILTGKVGELKLIGRDNTVQKLQCSIK